MTYVREQTDIDYRGRRRWSGNYGRVWLDGALLFEIVSFEAKITLDREDVIIGNSKDSKVVSMTGEGTITIKKVFNRGFQDYLEKQKAGQDARFTIIADLADPDMLNQGREKIKLENVWINELDIMHFTKGEVVETEIPFAWTPEDTVYLSTVELEENASIPAYSEEG